MLSKTEVAKNFRRWLLDILEGKVILPYSNKQNIDKYKSSYMLALGSYSEEASLPNYLWELDSTLADVMTNEGRIAIIGCIDVFTRRVKFLTQKTSNSL